MNTQLNGQMTIKDYATHHGISESTIRRRIKSGALPAEQVDGKWYIEVEQVDSQVEQANWQVEQQESQLVARLESEVEP